MARRTDQLTDAQEWVEEGGQIIPSLLERGARALLTPVNGYLITISRVISFVALEIGRALPGNVDRAWVALHRGGLRMVRDRAIVRPWNVVAAAGSSPGAERCRGLRGPAVLVLVRGARPLLAGALESRRSFACCRARRRRSRLRALQSHRVPIALIGAVRAFATRARHDVIIAAALAIPALAQLWVIQASLGTSAMPSIADASLAMARFLAYPLLLGFTDWPASAWIWVAAFLHALALVGLLIPPDSRKRRLALVGLFLLSAVSSVLRCKPPTMMHPAWAGPRYFFFPFVFLNWIWLDALLSGRTRLNRLVPATVAALILISTSRHFNRRHQHLDWKGAVRELSSQGQATFPVHYDGSRERQYKVKLAQCGNRICQVY